MTAQATLIYRAFLGGGSAAQVAALMAAVPTPNDVLAFLGVRVISDSTPVASPVVRTVVLGLNPVADGAATCALEPGDSTGAAVESITVTVPGSGYVIPPIVTFAGGRAGAAPQIMARTGPERVHQTIPSNPGILDPESQLSGALNTPAFAEAALKIVSAAVVAGGSGYSANTFIKLSGGRPLRPAVLTPTIALGAVTGVTVTDPGSGYRAVPTVTVVDPNVVPGTGASVSVSMGLDFIQLFRSGSGYTTPPTVVLTPYFQFCFPPTGNQAAPFANLMKVAIEQAILSPVSADPPVIA
jgi:hypothetical protein